MQCTTNAKASTYHCIKSVGKLERERIFFIWLPCSGLELILWISSTVKPLNLFDILPTLLLITVSFKSNHKPNWFQCTNKRKIWSENQTHQNQSDILLSVYALCFPISLCFLLLTIVKMIVQQQHFFRPVSHDYSAKCHFKTTITTTMMNIERAMLETFRVDVQWPLLAFTATDVMIQIDRCQINNFVLINILK